MVTLFKRKPKISATERVKALAAQGLPEPEIIKQMKKEGYSPKDVDAAMKEALKAAVAPKPAREEFLGPPAAEFERPVPLKELPEEGPPRIARELERRPELALPGEEMWARPVPERPLERPEIRPRPVIPIEKPEIEEEFRLPAARPRPVIERRAEIEEIAEAIVAERWEAFEREREAMNKRIDELDAKIATLDAVLKEIRGIKRTDIEEIKASVEGYRNSLAEVSSRMESIEKAVRDSLGPMLQTLRAMSDTIKALKIKREE